MATAEKCREGNSCLPSASQPIRKAFGPSDRGQKPADPAIHSNRAEETNLLMLTENSGDVFMQTGPDMKARYVSPSCMRLLGWPPEEMVGHGPEVFVSAEHLQSIVAATALMLAGADDGDPLARELQRKKDGTTVWVESKARLVRDPVTASQTIMRDIT